jgi:transposase
MGRVNTPILTVAQRDELGQGLKKGESHCFVTRCHVILLKAEGRSSKNVGLITEMSYIRVNHWVKRFKLGGISELKNKPGQGCKAVLDAEDREGLLSAVKQHRQRLQTAKAKWEASRGKSISERTLRRFLKVSAENINV